MLIVEETSRDLLHANSSTKTAYLSTRMIVKNQVFRLMSAIDLDAVLAIEKKCYPHPWSYLQFLQELENPVASILVCEIEGKIVGYICYWLVAGEMQILNLATSPQFRRNGIAARLLDKSFEHCSTSKLLSSWLEVRSGNEAAILLYRRYGFKLSGTRRSYYRDGEDAFVMVKTFTE